MIKQLFKVGITTGDINGVGLQLIIRYTDDVLKSNKEIVPIVFSSKSNSNYITSRTFQKREPKQGRDQRPAIKGPRDPEGHATGDGQQPSRTFRILEIGIDRVLFCFFVFLRKDEVR